MQNVILSICMPLHNRSKVAIEHIEDLLKCKDPRFDIVISDTSDEGKNLSSQWKKTDGRVKISRFSADTPPEKNWMLALECADGIFALHLNDRDIILKDSLPEILDFLEEHKEFRGGICKFVPINPNPLIYLNKNDALMNVPYFASHVTGLVFNADVLRTVKDLEFIFSMENGTHPHDILLGRLSQMGKMFIYTKEVWRYASPDFYKKNLSGVSFKESGLFFEPKERLFELGKTIEDLEKLDFADEIKQKKIDQMIKTYLGLSTNTYFYVLESDHETAHYGIPKEEFGILKRIRFSRYVFDIFDKKFHFSKSQKKQYKKWLMKTIMIPVIAKHTAKIKNKAFRDLLRKMKLKRDNMENATLR